jgi:hypothetical protein
MKRTFAAVLASLFVVVLVIPARAADHPDHEDALAQIKQHVIEAQFSTRTLLTDMEYVNGYRDGNDYIVVAKWTTTFPQSAKALISSGETHIAGLELIFGDFPAGASFQRRKSFRFMETENGWMYEGVVGAWF